jgi:hypothetical protein
MRKAAILIVNGFDRGNNWGEYDPAEATDYPWIDLCLRQLKRHDAAFPFTIQVWDNSHLRSHAEILAAHPEVAVHRIPLRLRDRARRLRDPRHGPALYHDSALDELARRLDADVDVIVTLDNDSFPIRDGWLAQLAAALEDGATITGVYRDEMSSVMSPFIHVSCLAMRLSDFQRFGSSFSGGKDVGSVLTHSVIEDGGRISPLRRSNAVNYHFLMGGIYGDLVYHQGAGSRHARFWTSDSGDAEADEAIRVMLRDRAFADLDGLISELRGASHAGP